MSVRQLTEPPYEPISRAEAKRWCRIDSDITDQDAVIDMLIQGMREYAENLTGRVFVQRTFQLVLPSYQGLYIDGALRTGIELPYPPLVSVDSITYIDTDGDVTTLATTEYDVHTWREPGIVVQEWNSTWPSFRGEPDAIRVNFTAGYAPGSPNDENGYQEVLPAKLKLWMQARISTLYENREQFEVGHIVQDIPRDFADSLLDSLVVGHRMF